jgi:hypothetical protein
MMTIDMDAVTAESLNARLYALRSGDRLRLVEMLQGLAVMGVKRFHTAMGYPTLHDYAVGYLGFTRAAAWRRIKAARCLLLHPELGEYLGDGRLNLTTLEHLHQLLRDRHPRSKEIIGRALGRHEDEVEALAASYGAVRKLKRCVIKPLPAPQPMPPSLELALGPSDGQPRAQESSGQRIEPIVAELVKIIMVVGKDFMADLDAVKAALSHQIPDRDTVTVLQECVKRTLAAIRKRREGSDHPRAKPSSTPKGRTIGTALRRAVMERDGRRCAFVSADGHHCGSDHQVEIHHLKPFALGGEATLANLSLRCRIHNQHHARQELGDAYMDEVIAKATRERPAAVRGGPAGSLVRAAGYVDIDEVAKVRPAMPADPEALAAGRDEVDHDRRAALGPVKGAPPPAEMVTFGSPGRTSGFTRPGGRICGHRRGREGAPGDARRS